MKSWRHFIVVLFSFFTWLNIFSQQNSSIRFTNITTKDGLCGYPVNNIYQDKTGYIWICTNNGLQRFDGKNFKTFYSDPQNKNSLPNDFINDIKEDKFGRYWIANAKGGLSIYNPADETFLRFNSHTDSLFNNDGDYMFSVAFTPDGNTAIISSLHGLYKFDVNNLQHKRFLTSNSGLLNNLTGALFSVGKNFFLLLSQSLQLYDTKKDIIYDEMNTPMLKKLLAFRKDDEFCLIIKDKEGRYWISYWWRGLYCYDPILDTIKEIIFDTSDRNKNLDKVVTKIIEDSSGNFYFGTFHAGIYYFDTRTNRIEAHYIHDPANPFSLISSSVTALLYDKQKTLWVGTDKGISTFNKANNRFSYPLLQPNGKDLVPNALLQSTDGHIWVGTYAGEGLFEYDKNFHFLKQYSFFEGSRNFLKNGIWRLNQIAKGDIMVCRQQGFSLIDPATGKQNDFSNMPALSTTATTGAFEDEQKRIWIGCWHSKLICLDSTYKKLTVFPTQYKAHLFAKEKDKLLLRIYDKGYALICFDMVNKKFYREPYYFFPQKDSTFLYQDPEIYDVKIYSGKIYLAAQDGLYIVNRKDGAMQHYRRANGIPTSDIFNIAKAANGNIFLTTRLGLCMFDTANKTFRNYHEVDGLHNEEFQADADILQLNNGMMLACDTHDLVAFYPDSLASLPIPPSPIITALRIGNQPMPVTASNKYRVSYRANTISIDFASLDFVHTSSLKYAYMLQGFDTGWNYVGNITTATYTNLDGGNYIFSVKAANATGQWNKTITTLHFFVTAPFYKQTWFFVLIALSIIAVSYIFYRMRIQRVIEMQKVRNSISRDLHDEVGSTLSSISMLSATAEHSLQNMEAKSAEMLVQRISNNTQRILDVMDEIIWAINPSNDSFENIIAKIHGFINDIADTTDIKFNMQVDASLEKINLPMKLKRNFYLIFKEALNNAANHSQCQIINIAIEKKHQFILLQIKDDGKGFNTSINFEGNGLKNMRQRADEIHGIIDIHSEPNKGTLLTLTAPIP